MKIFNALIIAIAVTTNVAFARLDVLDVEPRNVTVLSTQEMRFCYISFVMIDGKKYLIKQKKTQCIRKIGGVVRDAVTAHVIESFGVSQGITEIAHKVDIIPAGVEFPGKPRKDWPATIHTVAPGKAVKEQNTRFHRMNIKQANIGFRRDMLWWMTKHPMLAKLVAFDTFMCNHDRHRGNLFYNIKTDSFCAIDMDSAFKYNLCGLACKNFMAMFNDTRLELTSRELDALIEYNRCLRFLINNYYPDYLLELYDGFTVKAGFVQGSELYTERLALELKHNKRVIAQAYKDVQELVKIVDKLIKKVQKKRFDAQMKNN